MDLRPKQAIIAFTLASAGALLAMALALFFFEGGELMTIGVYLATALIFFALAGAFTKNTQWSWEVTFSFLILQILLVISAAYLDAISDLSALVFIILLLPILVFSSNDDVKHWFKLERL